GHVELRLVQPLAGIQRLRADRVMFGSDWPVCLLQATYAQVLGLTVDLLDGASPAEREAVLGGTARRVYRLAT
ncbi:amidohydrolase family protein, partial [Tsukamurella tyrosinosolvens]|uniref:amidohydrolase family protein n=1 Tax=Tsukamurella tyrosinosolvens TaxID=57704 RepID=UPI0024807E70